MRIFEKFQGLNIGLVIARGIDNHGEATEILNLIKKEEERIRKSLNSEKLSQHEKIAPWRNAYSLFGAKPSKYRCSVENLYRMVLEGTDLMHINKLVDIYNYISIKHMVPVGGDDLGKVEGNVTLTFAKGNERFQELNSSEIKSPHEGEVVYVDAKDVLCRRWNWRECEKSKMTEATRNAALVIEGLPPVSEEEISAMAGELAMLIKKHCGGSASAHVLNSQNFSINI